MLWPGSQVSASVVSSTHPTSPSTHLCLPHRHSLELGPQLFLSLRHSGVDTRSDSTGAIPASSSFPGKWDSSCDWVTTNLRQHTVFSAGPETDLQCPVSRIMLAISFPAARYQFRKNTGRSLRWSPRSKCFRPFIRPTSALGGWISCTIGPKG